MELTMHVKSCLLVGVLIAVSQLVLPCPFLYCHAFITTATRMTGAVDASTGLRRGAAARSAAARSAAARSAAARSAAARSAVATGNNSQHSPSNNDTIQNSKSGLSKAAQWHQQRRKDMLSTHSTQIMPLETDSHGLFVGLPLLILSNVSLALMAIFSSQLSILQILAVAFFPGSMFSLWQLQICHDCLHGSLLPKKRKQSIISPDDEHTDTSTTGIKCEFGSEIKSAGRKIREFLIRHRNTLHKQLLFWGSMPSAFGYYLYLQYGHLTHHKSLGDQHKSNLSTLFNSSHIHFEDGDALFVAHRMKLKGDVGPQISLPKLPHQTETKIVTMSISNAGFSFWKEGYPLRNALLFTTSFLFERVMLIFNDFIVAITGRNFFFPNKPLQFHKEVATYCRVSVLVRLGLCFLAKSWKPLFFLYLAETLWSIPPHPACAMFITNHGSGSENMGRMNNNNNNNNSDNDGIYGGDCIPSSSTYAGKLYSLFTLGTNYHVEHHDFPSIPLHELGKLQKIAPDYYNGGYDSNGTEGRKKKDNIFSIMVKTFSKPEFYACMDFS